MRPELVLPARGGRPGAPAPLHRLAGGAGVLQRRVVEGQPRHLVQQLRAGVQGVDVLAVDAQALVAVAAGERRGGQPLREALALLVHALHGRVLRKPAGPPSASCRAEHGWLWRSPRSAHAEELATQPGTRCSACQARPQLAKQPQGPHRHEGLRLPRRRRRPRR